MTKHETPFVTEGDLIIVRVLVTGPLGTTGGRFVLDTGAALTTMTHELADLIGYSARDGVKRARVRTAIGSEEGYVLNVAEFAVLGFTMASFPIHVFDLGYDDIEGLVGMNFLNKLNYEVRSEERRILVEKIERHTSMAT
jgi:clan AA aspartic protease (TIGR02281 family)